MHSSRELRSSLFEIAVEGRRAGLEELFEGFGEHDRLGLVMSRPCGAVGASALIATITAFYDVQRALGDDFFIYPDYYLFHVGGPLGDHGRLDVWPPARRSWCRTTPTGARGDRRPGDHAARGRGRRGATTRRSGGAGERTRAHRDLPRVLGLGPRGRRRRAHREQPRDRGLRGGRAGPGSPAGAAGRGAARSRSRSRRAPGRSGLRAGSHRARPRRADRERPPVETYRASGWRRRWGCSRLLPMLSGRRPAAPRGGRLTALAERDISRFAAIR